MKTKTKFSVGDKVVIITSYGNSMWSMKYPLGTVVTITKIHGSLFETDIDNTLCVMEEDIRPLTKLEKALR